MAMRLSPCPTCTRHVRVSEGDCPFCGARLSIVASEAGWLSIALLGLSLAGCDPKSDATKTDDAKSKTEVQPAPEPAPAPEPEPTNEPLEPEPPGTTGLAAEGTTSTSGLDQGATTQDEQDAGAETDEPPPPKPKYGAPRPAKKYGAPPMP